MDPAARNKGNKIRSGTTTRSYTETKPGARGQARVPSLLQQIAVDLRPAEPDGTGSYAPVERDLGRHHLVAAAVIACYHLPAGIDDQAPPGMNNSPDQCSRTPRAHHDVVRLAPHSIEGTRINCHLMANTRGCRAVGGRSSSGYPKAERSSTTGNSTPLLLNGSSSLLCDFEYGKIVPRVR